MTEDGDKIRERGRMAPEGGQGLGRGGLDVALELVKGAVRVGRFPKQRRQRDEQPRRNPLFDSRQIHLGTRPVFEWNLGELPPHRRELYLPSGTITCGAQVGEERPYSTRALHVPGEWRLAARIQQPATELEP